MFFSLISSYLFIHVNVMAFYLMVQQFDIERLMHLRKKSFAYFETKVIGVFLRR